MLGTLFALLALAAIGVTIVRRRARRRPLPAPCGDPDVDHLVPGIVQRADLADIANRHARIIEAARLLERSGPFDALADLR